MHQIAWEIFQFVYDLKGYKRKQHRKSWFDLQQMEYIKKKKRKSVSHDKINQYIVVNICPVWSLHVCYICKRTKIGKYKMKKKIPTMLDGPKLNAWMCREYCCPSMIEILCSTLILFISKRIIGHLLWNSFVMVMFSNVLAIYFILFWEMVL